MNELRIKIKSLEKHRLEMNQVVSQVESQLLEEYSKIFEKDTKLQTAIKELEDSKEFGIDDGIYRWNRFDFDDYKDNNEVIEYLEQYLNEHHFINIDIKNDAIMKNEGFNLILDHDGNIYDEDSQEFIIDHSEYTNKSKRNKLVNNWMEKNGYFPGLFSVDRYNNVFLINLNEKRGT